MVEEESLSLLLEIFIILFIIIIESEMNWNESALMIMGRENQGQVKKEIK